MNKDNTPTTTIPGWKLKCGSPRRRHRWRSSTSDSRLSWRIFGLEEPQFSK